MANCNIVPFNSLANADEGGSWQLTSRTIGGSTETSGTANLIFNDGTNAESVSIGSNISNTYSLQHNFSVSFDMAIAGDYVFTYILGDSGTCADQQTVTVTVVDGIFSGQSGNTVEICSDDTTSYSILGMFLTGTNSPNTVVSDGSSLIDTTGTMEIPATWPAASWTPGTAGDPDYTANGTIQVEVGGVSPTPGPDYVFEYTVTAPGGNTDCENCQSTSTLTIKVLAAFNAGDSPGSFTVCNLHDAFIPTP